MASLGIGVGRWMAIVSAGLVVVSLLAAPAANAASAVLPCPKSSGSLFTTASAGGSAPSPLNPCPGWEWAKTYGTPGVNDNADGIDVTSDGGAILTVHTAGFQGVTVLKLDTNGTVQWQKQYSGYYGYIRQTSDGGYALVTYVPDPVTVYKLDALGSILWQRAYDSPGRDLARSIALTADGGYVLGVQMEYPIGSYNYDAWILRLDSAGAVVWQKAYGGPYGDVLETVRPTPDGGYVVAGRRSDQDAPGAWILKLDSTGGIVWQKRYDSQSTGLSSIQVASDGGLVFTGLINGKLAVVKLTATGGVVWQKTYGALDRMDGSMARTADGGYVVSTSIAPANQGNYWDFMVLRIDGNGNRLWQRTYGGSLSEQVCIEDCIREASDGNILVAGQTYSFSGGADSEAWLLRLFKDGTISSTCAPGFGTGVNASTVSGVKLKVGNPGFVASTWSVTSNDPGATASDGGLVTMTQCSA